MQQIIKRYFWIILLAAGMQTTWGYALLGPETLANGADGWQTAAIGYDLGYANTIIAGGPVFLGDVGGPRNIAEEYRRNVPVLYYAYDQSFLNFFGADGAAQVDAACGIMNSVPSADTIQLTNYPDYSLSINGTAASYFLTDLKSVSLHCLVEQLGLADPERFVWTLHGREPFAPGTCPIDIAYSVVQRNYDDTWNPSPTSLSYSSYVNDVLYTYFIVEDCTGTPTAITVPFSSEPEDSIYNAVAANNFDGERELDVFNLSNANQPTTLGGGLQVGSFYTGLTRDDVAGLKYLFTTNNVNYELPDPFSLLFSVVTNTAMEALFPSLTTTNITGTNGAGFYTFDGNFGYGDYGALVATSLTNSPAALQAMYPGLLIANSTNYFVLVTNWVYIQYFTNASYGSPYGSPPRLVTVSNAVLALQERYFTTFANVFTHNISSNTVSQLQTITVSAKYGSEYGTPPQTNFTTQTVVSRGVSGDFFLLPLFHTNVCPLDLLYVGLTNVQAITNVLSGASTNVVTSTNTTSLSSTLIQINYFTNYTWVGFPVNCAEVPNAVNLYQGIGGTKFQRADYDSLLSQYFNPVTNYYTMVSLTNVWVPQRFVRVITQPDILMEAADQGGGAFVGSVTRSVPNFLPSPILNGLAGPGTIAASAVIGAPQVISYDKIGDSVWNGYFLQFLGAAATNQFLGQYGSIPALAWASFDDTTNAPELYPNDTSIQNLQNQLVVQLTPSSMPNGWVGVAYSQVISASGGAFQQPFSWSLNNYSLSSNAVAGLPPGLGLSTVNNPDGSTAAQISGTPASPGTYDFVLQLTDNLGRSVQWNLSITITY